jgi:hypothetical protein
MATRKPDFGHTDYQRGAMDMKHEIIIYLMRLHNFVGADVYKALAQKIYRMELPEDGKATRFEGFDSDWTAADAAGARRRRRTVSRSNIKSWCCKCDRCGLEPVPPTAMTTLYQYPEGSTYPTLKDICPNCVPLVKAELEAKE